GGEHPGLQGRRPTHDQGGGRAQGADRTDARTSAEPGVAVSGTLYIVAAPSGAGKTSLVRALLEREPGISLSVSYTSRLPRANEVDGQHYHFVSREVFEHMAEAGAFFEYANVHGDYKGTARLAIEPLLAAGHDVLLEIDWQGARQVRAQWADSISIFVLPPSRAELERR